MGVTKKSPKMRFLGKRKKETLRCCCEGQSSPRAIFVAFVLAAFHSFLFIWLAKRNSKHSPLFPPSLPPSTPSLLALSRPPDKDNNVRAHCCHLAQGTAAVVKRPSTAQSEALLTGASRHPQ